MRVLFYFALRLSYLTFPPYHTAGGSADPNKNLQLAAVLKRAREIDLPKENIEKALAKVSARPSSCSAFAQDIMIRLYKGTKEVTALPMKHWRSNLSV